MKKGKWQYDVINGKFMYVTDLEVTKGRIVWTIFWLLCIGAIVGIAVFFEMI